MLVPNLAVKLQEGLRISGSGSYREKKPGDSSSNLLRATKIDQVS
ncbi:protein of unknown function [Candidatus Nitrosocosmicus franklandus]|uniref:Uncharacterized protein n=1 Tax=Candidatus Nitrosocosmicus franklandianus TaxID=1798806 RepID=A0A484I5T1_9ARCH|nr:protein of unknown function [Candidatus Nitrosocosmicus franklandus]